MSKQSTNKEIQGYQASPIVPTCSNCTFFKSKIVRTYYASLNYYDREKNLRCGIGGFAVKKHGTCLKHVLKEIKK